MPARPDDRGAGFGSTVPFTEARIRAASIYCSDGRFGEQIDEFLHQGLGLPRYDRLAVPGGPACFSGTLSVFWEGHSGERQLEFLVRVHGLERVVLIAHAGCAFYLDWLKTRPEELEARQIEDLLKAAARLRLAHPSLSVEMYLARRSAGDIGSSRFPRRESRAEPGGSNSLRRCIGMSAASTRRGRRRRSASPGRGRLGAHAPAPTSR